VIDVDLFQRYRPLLFGIAYRMLGSAAEAEDTVQDAFLRYAGAAPAQLRSPQAYLSTIVTRLALDRLTAARATRESYIGPWLPEPVLTTDDNGAASAERRESIRLAFLVLLETLTPQERAVFLLREVFEYTYDEVAEMLQLSQANCRQLLHRARTRIAERQPRFQPSPEEQRRLVGRFVAAVEHGDVQGLATLLAEEVVFTGDGGGKASTARRLVAGSVSVARLLLGLVKHFRELPESAQGSLRLASVNGSLALLTLIGTRIDSVMSWQFEGERIASVATVRNPDKLIFLQSQLDSGALLPLEEC